MNKTFLKPMDIRFLLLSKAMCFMTMSVVAQPTFYSAEGNVKDVVIKNIIKEANNQSQLEDLAFELVDLVGPRLVGSPGMQKASDWTISKFKEWGIPARTQVYGEWRAWDRGITHIDMVYPRTNSISGTQLAWSPSTNGKAILGEVIALADFKDAIAFQKWLPTVKGKYVMISMPQPTGRPDYQWQEYATKSSLDRMNQVRDSLTTAWNKRIKNTGYTTATLPGVLEKAGALGILTSNWSKEFGTNKIFGAKTAKVPSVDVSLEDYGALYRLAEKGAKPQISVATTSKDLGVAPAFNTIAEIKGTEHPSEYVILSAHLDSWDGATGATDNATAVITMMEVARILKKYLPNPKRTILIGLWGSEEQGLNGSRAFVADNPDLVSQTQAVFNLDNGTGRVVRVGGSGFVDAYDYLGRWMSDVPREITKGIQTDFPGIPGAGGTDHAAFVAVGIPAFNLNSLSWGYATSTWHTNMDTYDKIVFDDLKANVILTAIMTYNAAEEPKLVSRARRVLPLDEKGNPGAWPIAKEPRRTSEGY